MRDTGCQLQVSTIRLTDRLNLPVLKQKKKVLGLNNAVIHKGHVRGASLSHRPGVGATEILMQQVTQIAG